MKSDDKSGVKPTSGDSCACGPGGCCEPVSRREFLYSAGAGLSLLSLPNVTREAIAGPFTRAQDDISHFVPADKKLAKAWVDALMARGEPRVCRENDLKFIAMPIGGIAAGQLYLRGDGTLSSWQIFNQNYFSGYGRDNYDQPPATSPLEQGFAVVVDNGGNQSARRLNSEDFGDVAFTGQHPIGIVDYKDDDCPVTVGMEVFSPFIPLNAADSALPATIFHLTVTNTSDRPIRAGMLAWLENGVCFHNAAYLRAERVTRIERGERRSAITHGVRPTPKGNEPTRPPIILADFEGDNYGEWKVEGDAFGLGPARGTLTNQQRVSGFEGNGLVNTFLGGDRPHGKLTSPEFEINRRHLNFMIGGGNHSNQTCINLLIDGEVVRTQTGRNEELLRWESWDVRELTGRAARIEIVDTASGGWGHINVDQIELNDEPRFGLGGALEELEDFGTMTLMHDGAFISAGDAAALLAPLPESQAPRASTDAAYPVADRRSGAAATSFVDLQPGESRTFTFILAWHFPNRGNVGHFYANRFNDASSVARYVFDEHDRLTRDTRLWHDTFYDSTLPHWLLDRLHSTVGNLATGTTQWWKNGRFWAWEGVGCCSGTCTHVWNYAHALARLFPELERSVREMQDLGAALHDNGLVGFRGERNGAYAADGQAGTILKCYREHLMSADNEFLKRNWPNIREVLQFSMEQDGDGDGLIENSQHNTYDINFFGPNTFVGALYHAALRAGEEMARIVGDDAFAQRCRTAFERGRDLTVERLFNGEYFIQVVDLAAHPRDQYGEGCLADQLFGQGWAHHVGLGYLYPTEQVRSALESVWKYNWAPDIRAQNEKHTPERWFARPGDAGLFTCTWPKSKYLAQGVRYREEVWTGIEYQVAGHMIHEGMVTEGLAICRAIHDRYDPARRNPYNEVECGDHYARALASWGVYTVLAGFEYDGPRGHIGFAPRLTPENFRAAFTAAEGWGEFSQTVDAQSQRCAIDLKWGTLRISAIAIEQADVRRAGNDRITITLNGRTINATPHVQDRRLELRFNAPVTINAGQRVEIVVA